MNCKISRKNNFLYKTNFNKKCELHVNIFYVGTKIQPAIIIAHFISHVTKQVVCIYYGNISKCNTTWKEFFRELNYFILYMTLSKQIKFDINFWKFHVNMNFVFTLIQKCTIHKIVNIVIIFLSAVTFTKEAIYFISHMYRKFNWKSTIHNAVSLILFVNLHLQAFLNFHNVFMSSTHIYAQKSMTFYFKQ